ncbi:unnamed protein product [Linum trigynum]|uniref:Uncharacterized protein n=1 Tax=Linum trigynum TaxID=586398 RepID=A0AAV2DWG7_9ROSI
MFSAAVFLVTNGGDCWVPAEINPLKPRPTPQNLNPTRPKLDSTCFELPKGTSRSFQAPTGWSDRFWGQTGCDFDNSGRGSCATADCGSGQIECNGAGARPLPL